MAVFLKNDCKFQGCGQNFQYLGDLIHHIEDEHIDSDPKVLEKQETEPPSSLALSYILRFFTEAAKRDRTVIQNKCLSMTRTATPTGSELDEEEAASEDESDDSWSTQEEFNVDHILGITSCKDGHEMDKPFACPVNGCKKRYKNINGIKYHARHGHRREPPSVPTTLTPLSSTLDTQAVKKTYKCQCGKSYKTTNGLKNHSLSHHPTAELLSLQALFPPALMKNGSGPMTGVITALPATGIFSGGVITLTQAHSSQPITIPITKVITSTPSSSSQSTPINFLTHASPLITVVPPLIPTPQDTPVSSTDPLAMSGRE